MERPPLESTLLLITATVSNTALEDVTGFSLQAAVPKVSLAESAAALQHNLDTKETLFTLKKTMAQNSPWVVEQVRCLHDLASSSSNSPFRWSFWPPAVLQSQARGAPPSRSSFGC